MKSRAYWLMACASLISAISVIFPVMMSGNRLSEAQFALVTIACAITFVSALRIVILAWEHQIKERYALEAIRRT